MTSPPSDGWSRIVGRRTRLQIPMRVLAGPLAGACVTAASTRGVPITDAALAVFLAFSVSAMLTQRNAKWAPLLPLMRRAWNGAGPFVGFLACVVLKAAAALPGVSFLTLALAALVCGLVSELPLTLVRQSRRSQVKVRTAVVGSANAAALLKQEMDLARVADLTIVGRVDVSEAEAYGDDAELVPLLGNLDSLADVARRDSIDLLVITGEVSRLHVYRKLAVAPVAARVRAWDLSGFCEEFFGHVPMSEINATWFAYVMHPKFRETAPMLKRTMDIAVALVAGVAALPLLAVLALINCRPTGAQAPCPSASTNATSARRRERWHWPPCCATAVARPGRTRSTTPLRMPRATGPYAWGPERAGRGAGHAGAAEGEGFAPSMNECHHDGHERLTPGAARLREAIRRAIKWPCAASALRGGRPTTG